MQEFLNINQIVKYFQNKSNVIFLEIELQRLEIELELSINRFAKAWHFGHKLRIFKNKIDSFGKGEKEK